MTGQTQNDRANIAKLTKSVVNAAQPGSRRYIVWDNELKGFGLRVERSGIKSYLVRYRPGGGRSAPLRQFVIGRHGALTPEQARKDARIQLAEVARGADPALNRSTRRKEPTIADLVERYITEHLRPHNKPTTVKEFERIARGEISSEFGTTRIGDLTRPMIHKWHATFADRPYQGNRCLAVLRKMLSLACRDWEVRKDNPALGIKLFREIRRERFATDDDLTKIGSWLKKVEKGKLHPPGAVLVTRLLALTGLRLGEVLELEWDYVDLREKVIRLPDTKVGARTVPLGASAVALLIEINPQGQKSGRLARNVDGSDLKRDQFRRFWADLRKGTGLTDLRPHDFRHGAATFGAQAGANAFLLRDFMGHTTVAMTGEYVARVVDPVRALADVVSARVATALSKQT